ncbi:trans-sulfuration enzyme family protein [Saccharospirillum mangrovi]|uniref:trans-sulfuration enzyme family protein n=1 Tax=Saccharospirillum mangrovi TaxID=2161747 RepID=UPI000D3CA594|nr:PLP-dependent aspartate aminotransferase family protein [Saccharospirillum mangrovi]
MANEKQPATLAAQALGFIDDTTQAVVPPIYTATTYQRAADNSFPTGNVYSRPNNPTYHPAEDLLTALEKGADSMLFASGMAAATAVFQTLKTGDHVIAPKVMYWSLRNWLKQFAERWQLAIDFVETEDLAQVEAALQPGKTKLVWLESPANPMWSVTDIAAVCQLAHAAGAKVAVDSTVATPILCRPLELGADLVMHSATKYLNGHSDVIAGALVTPRKDEWWEQLTAVRSQQGGVLGPFEASLLLRGMRTLDLRVKAASRNALAISEAMQQHPAIAEVLYPGLPTNPYHALAKQQMEGGFTGMVSIRIKGGAQAAIATAAQLNIFKRATSLGGVESLVEHRASIEGEGTPVPDDLLRLSIGIEAVEDLIDDLNQALASL